MRCPSCGTENAPDSRFCGGCGARLAPSEPPRLAPTQKISDDAPMPPQQQAQPMSQPPRAPYAAPQPPSIPPAPFPPTNGMKSIPPGLSGPSPIPSRGSMSMPIRARRPWALILVVLAIDLGLAAAGGWMLSEGLGGADASPPAKATRGSP